MTPQARRITVILISLAVATILSVVVWKTFNSSPSPGEQLALLYCSSCHVFPDPSLLNKETWANSVLPQMAFRMGFRNDAILLKIDPQDRAKVLASLPSQPMVTDEEWTLIRNYFVEKAPAIISITNRLTPDPLQQFDPQPIPYYKPFVTVLKYDSAGKKLYIGNRLPELTILDNNFKKLDSIPLSSPASYISLKDKRPILSLLGILLPNDQAKGSLVSFDAKARSTANIMDSIQRPVFFDQADMNNDGLDDYIICEFGHFTGSLSLYETRDHGKFVRHFINRFPGSRKVIVRDFNNDGKKDILALMTQGDERIVLYTNKGDLKFEEKNLLRFPPVYGSNYFELADFNKDGHIDILLTNGDNGDFSVMLKPYHAVRIFTNDGSDNFSETVSLPMPGASEAKAIDFDNDGDLDIAAISFFPDFDQNPEQGFIYFENKGGNSFKPQTTSLASSGRWLVMETADPDLDGDIDIFIGSLSFRGLGASDVVYREWLRNGTAVLFLENKLK